jgi:hypothetical protein
MPAQHCLRLDDEQRLLPSLQLAREEDEEPALGGREVRAFDRTVEDDELLAQQQVFRNQLRFTASEISDGAAYRVVGDRPCEAGDGRAGRLQPSRDERLDPFHDPEHDWSPSYRGDVAQIRRAEGVYVVTGACVEAVTRLRM